MYWQQILSVKECVNEAEDIIATLEAIKQGEYQRVNLKKLQGSQLPLYRAKINDKARLIFAVMPYKKENTLVLVDILRDHNYETCRFLKESYLKNYLKTIKIHDLREFADGGFEEVPSIEFSDLTSVITDARVDTVELQASFRYQHETIILDPAQQELLNSPLPALVEGVAGSGKTCTGFAKILNFGLIEEEKEKKIIYLTMSDKLINQMKDQWMQNIQNPERVDVQFLNYKDFLINIINRMDSNYSTVSINHFQEWLSNYLKINAKFREKGYSIELLLAEARFLSGCKESDYLNHQNLITDINDKIDFQNLYRLYQESLEKNRLINIELSAVLLSEPIADLIIVDESQAFSGAQLQTIRYAVANTQVMYCYDRYQNLSDDADHLNLLKQDLIRDGKAVTIAKLTRGHRCKKDVADFANNVLNLRGYASGKKGFSSSQSRLTILEEDHQTRCDWVSQEDFNHRIKGYFNTDNNNWAVVVPNLESIPQAKEFYNGYVNIFTQEEIRGLEFDYVILHQPFKDQIFKEMRAKILAYQTEEKKYMDITDNQRHRFRISLSKLFTAATRSKGFLIIVAESPNRVYQQVLLPSIESKSPIIFDERLTLASSEEEWKELAKKYIKQGLIEKATEILKKHTTSVEINLFIKSIEDSSDADFIEKKEALEAEKLAKDAVDDLAASNLMNLTIKDTGAMIQTTPLIKKTICRNKKMKLHEMVEEEELIPESIENYLRTQVKTTQDLALLFLTASKKKGGGQSISRNFFKLFEKNSDYLIIFSKFCESLPSMNRCNAFEIIHNIMKGDSKFFNELILDINNILNNCFDGLIEKNQRVDPGLFLRVKTIHSLFFIILSNGYKVEKPTKKVVQFLLMIDYYLLEQARNTGNQPTLFVSNFSDCFCHDNIWNDYDLYFSNFTTVANSLGSLFLKIKYYNQKIMECILKADDFKMYFDILRTKVYGDENNHNILEVETYNQGDDYHKTLTRIYFECKFLNRPLNYLSKEGYFSRRTEDFFKKISTKEGLQQLLIILRENDDFIKREKLDEEFEIGPVRTCANFYKPECELFRYEWFVSCLRDEDIWPELYEFLFEVKNPFIKNIIHFLSTESLSRKNFLFDAQVNIALRRFLSQKFHIQILDLLRILATEECMLEKEKKITNSRELRVTLRLINSFYFSKMEMNLLKHELVQIILQNNLEKLEDMLINNFEEIKEIFKIDTDLSVGVILLNNYELLAIFKKYYPVLIYGTNPIFNVCREQLINMFILEEDDIQDKRVIDLLKKELSLTFEDSYLSICLTGNLTLDNQFALSSFRQALLENDQHHPCHLIAFLYYMNKFTINFDIYAEALMISVKVNPRDKLAIFEKFHEFIQKSFILNPSVYLIYNKILEEDLIVSIEELYSVFKKIGLSTSRDLFNPKSKKNWYHQAAKKFKAADIYFMNELHALDSIDSTDKPTKLFDINHQDEDDLTPMDIFLHKINNMDLNFMNNAQENKKNIIDTLDALVLGGEKNEPPKITLNIRELPYAMRSILYVKGYALRNDMLSEYELKNLPLKSVLIGIHYATEENNNRDILAKMTQCIKNLKAVEDSAKLEDERNYLEFFLNSSEYDRLKYLILAFSFNHKLAINFGDLILNSILKNDRSKDLLGTFIKMGFLKMEGSMHLQNIVKSLMEKEEYSDLKSIFQESTRALIFNSSQQLNNIITDKSTELRRK